MISWLRLDPDAGSLPRAAVVVFGLLFFVILYFANAYNPGYLPIGPDGTDWKVQLCPETAYHPLYSVVGTDPLQGNFEANFPVFREYVGPGLLAILTTGKPPHRTSTSTLS